MVSMRPQPPPLTLKQNYGPRHRQLCRKQPLLVLLLPPKPAYYAELADFGDGAELKIFENRGFIQTATRTGNGYLDFLTATGAKIKFVEVNPTVPVVAVDFLRDNSVPSKLPPTFFTAWQSAVNGGSVHVHQGFKRTSMKQWSDVQILSPPAEFNEQSYFGKSISADQRTHRKLAVGCPGCNATSTSGQVYLYSPNPAGTAWSQSQVLTLTADRYNRLGDRVNLHDNVLLASIQESALLRKGYVVYQRGPGEASSFEMQQLLAVKNGNITSADVYEETIVLGNSGSSYGSTVGAGEVQILYPSTPEFGAKPTPGKPRPVQWSVQQVLRASDFAANDAFGAGVSIDRNTIAVAATGAGAAYVYKREEKSGKWSQQQILATTNPALVSSTGSKFVVSQAGTSLPGALFSTQGNWKCLIISLEDHFGDGWDTAELIASAPDGTRDYFSLGCDGDNPLQLRYCPNDRSEEGIYSFSVPEAIKAKHYWELQWGLFDENTGMWHKGKWDTKMDFHWDSDSLTFAPRKFDKERANATTCTPCPSRPTEKPSPTLRRSLKSSTHAPTVSPAPTLAVSNIYNWRYLTLNSDGEPWFDNQYQSTEFYVSDAHGHRLIQSGTACEVGTATQCWVDLPDGDYILRVGGALDANQGDHEFTFCKTVTAKTAGNQMMFRIQDDDCSIVTFASRNAVCRSNGYSILSTFYLVLNVNMIVSGTTVTTASNSDRTVFNAAVASLFHGMQATDVDLVSATPSGSSTFVSANIHMSSARGYNLLDVDDEAAFETFLKETFTSRSNELTLAVALGSGSVASSFSHVTKVEFVDYHIAGSDESLPTSATGVFDEVTSSADTFTSSTTESTTSSNSHSSKIVLDGLSYSGYFLAAVGVMFLVGFVVVKRQASSTHSAVPEDSETSPKIEAGRRQLSQSSLTVGDLNELAQMEQEYLKIVTK